MYLMVDNYDSFVHTLTSYFAELGCDMRIVRNDALSKDGVTAQQLVDEACRVARSYTRSHSTRRPLLRCGSPVFWSAAGALGIALVWLLTALV